MCSMTSSASTTDEATELFPMHVRALSLCRLHYWQLTSLMLPDYSGLWGRRYI